MNEIIDDPQYLAYRLDLDKEFIEFLPISNEEINSVAWLRRSAIDQSRHVVTISLAEIQAYLVDNQRSFSAPFYIFHTAYCASTYLSRCLGESDNVVSLREPQILLDAANAKRLRWKSRTTKLTYSDLPELTLRLLRKHAQREQSLVIKPINSVNNIIPELFHAVPDSKAILLYTDARNFLLSALKKGEPARQTLRAMFDLLRCDFPHLTNLRISDAIHMSDLKLILTLWRLQIEQAETVIRQPFSDGRLLSLHAEQIINHSSQAVLAAGDFFGLGLDKKRVKEISSGEISQRDAKEPQKKFSIEKRASVYAEIERFYGEDLSNGLQWLNANNPKIGLEPQLSAPLILAS